MSTKFGELWSTNGENGTVFQPTQNQLFQMLVSQGLRKVGIGWPTIGNAYLIGHMGLPSKLGFNQVFRRKKSEACRWLVAGRCSKPGL